MGLKIEMGESHKALSLLLRSKQKIIRSINASAVWRKKKANCLLDRLRNVKYTRYFNNMCLLKVFKIDFCINSRVTDYEQTSTYHQSCIKCLQFNNEFYWLFIYFSIGFSSLVNFVQLTQFYFGLYNELIIKLKNSI